MSYLHSPYAGNINYDWQYHANPIIMNGRKPLYAATTTDKKGMDLARTGMAYLRIEISPSPSYVGEFRNLVAPNPTYIEYTPIRLLFRNSVSRCYDAGRCFTRVLVSDNAFVSRLLFCFLRGTKPCI